MGYDAAMLKVVLESFVDEVAEESLELIVERPRFVHATVLVADGAELQCVASCTRQLDDVQVQEATVRVVDEEDEVIERALRQLLAAKRMLDTPRNSVCADSAEDAFTSNRETRDLMRQMDGNGLNKHEYVTLKPTVL